MLDWIARRVPHAVGLDWLGTVREPVLVVDPAGAISFANEPAGELLGRSAPELTGIKLTDLLTNLAGCPAQWDEWRACSASHPGGATLELEAIAVPLGRPGSSRYTVTLRDRTARKAAEREIRLGQERLTMALAMGNEVIWEWHVPSGCFLMITPGEEVLGYRQTDLGSMIEWWQAKVHPDDWKRLDSAIQKHLTGGSEVFQEEYRLQHKSGEYRWVFTRGRVVERDDLARAVRFIGTTVDRTERRLLEQQFIQSQKMEALGQLAGGVAHDFNNALQSILGMAELMAMRPDRTQEESKADLHEIRVAAERAGAMTRQLLSFSRRQSSRQELLDLDATVAEVIRLIHRLLGPNIVMHTDRASDPVLIKCDRALLEHALLNLALNARDAMPEGGTLTFRTRVLTVPGVGEDAEPSPHAALEVVDTGVGMPEELRQRIFEPFFTTKPVGRGTGLGLPMVYNFVTQSGGRIEVDSAPGQGSTFRLLLPLARVAGRRLRPTRDLPMQRGAGTILVVEDEADIRALCRSALSELGYHVLAAANADEAIAMMRDGRPIHLMITDVVMPGLTGIELAEWVAAHRPDIRVGFISGYMQGTEEQLASVQLEHVLAKPFRLPELADLVRRLLDPARPDAPLPG